MCIERSHASAQKIWLKVAPCLKAGCGWSLELEEKLLLIFLPTRRVKSLIHSLDTLFSCALQLNHMMVKDYSNSLESLRIYSHIYLGKEKGGSCFALAAFLCHRSILFGLGRPILSFHLQHLCSWTKEHQEN